MPPNRRQFLTTAAVLAAGCARKLDANLSALGGLVPVADAATGLELIWLPPEFRYRSFGWALDPMTDGFPTPPLHDGMGIIAEDGSKVVLVRNHELVRRPVLQAPEAGRYDPAAFGGTTTLKFDVNNETWEEARFSLSGTLANCAGGVTPWGTWLSCEEAVAGTDGRLGPRFNNARMPLTKDHGYVFEVPPGGASDARPLKALGRFRHEAAAVDPETSIVYLTEDNQPESGLFRFVPKEPGSLKAGSLEMLAVEGLADLRQNLPLDEWLDVAWVQIRDPDLGHNPGTLDSAGVLTQGKRNGGAVFRRLEGCWMGDGQLFFTDTTGGAKKRGQVFRYDPRRDRIKLLFESTDKSLLDHPDNITTTPNGGLIICEDAPGRRQRLLAFNPSSGPVPLAQNNVVLDGEVNDLKGDFRGAEWAGATFSPDGRWLFANIQVPGITVAITGPWETVGL